MDKTIICYCAGGLGNRIRPLSSCYALSVLTNRKLIIIWPDTSRCQAKFNQLYDSSLDVYPDTFLRYIENSCSIYGQEDSIYNEKVLFNRPEIFSLYEKKGLIPINRSMQIQNDPNQHIVVIGNNFLDGSDPTLENMFIKQLLQPTSFIRNKIEEQQEILKLDFNTIGIHARATDFFEDHGIGYSYYYNLISNNTPENSRIFVCSDSKDMELAIKEYFHGKREIVIREQKSFLSKIEESKQWVNNLDTTAESVVDAVVDMFLLSKTNFKVYHPASTFAHIVLRML